MSFVSWDNMYLNIFRWYKVQNEKWLKLPGEFSYGQFRDNAMVMNRVKYAFLLMIIIKEPVNI